MQQFYEVPDKFDNTARQYIFHPRVKGLPRTSAAYYTPADPWKYDFSDWVYGLSKDDTQTILEQLYILDGQRCHIISYTQANDAGHGHADIQFYLNDSDDAPFYLGNISTMHLEPCKDFAPFV